MSISGGVGGASGSGSGSGGGGVVPRGISLANTVHSEVASCLPLPSLPVFCGSLEHDLRLFDEQQIGYGYSNEYSGDDVLKISSLLQATDVSYLNLRAEATDLPGGYVEHLDLYDEVIGFNSEAFEHIASGPIKKAVHNSVVPDETIPDKRLFEQNIVSHEQDPDDIRETRHQHEHDAPTSSRKPKAKKRGGDESFLISEPEAAQLQAVEGFCELLEGLCSRSEIPSEDHDETEWLPLSVADIKKLVNEVVSIRGKKFLHLVPIDLLERMLRILDHQIHRAEGLSINQCEHSNSDIILTISIALESIHAALLLMAYSNMPKQIYKEEIIERIVEFARRQIMDLMSACDPTYRNLNKPSENGFLEDDEEEEDADFGSASKRRRNSRNVKVKRSGTNRVSAAVNSILQKLCTLLSLLKDLLLIERLSDSCILQLVKTCFSTFLVDNIQLLQLKSISLIGGIFYRYSQHRVYVMDEANQLLLKLPFSKRIPRTYHLPDEEQRQIQMITALLIQLVHCSANLPESLMEAPETMFEISIDASYPNQCYDAVTDACCLFWTGVLQRFTNAKNQNYDASELKIMMENLVMDLLTTLNLPEYPASAPILEVLCVLLLQNAGLKSKDIAARSIAIDILGTIAARLKRDAVLCKRESFWVVQELINGDDVDRSHPKDSCSVCLDERIEKPLVTCQGCHRLFHVDCMGVREHEASGRSWLCQFCLCRKQLLVLHSYCKSNGKVDGNSNRSQSKSGNADITKTEIVQQMLLNYLQDGSSEDMHIFTRWLYLCLWYKADPSCQQKVFYYLARLNSKAITGGSGMVSSLLTRHSVKKITLALGQNNSFSRGYDKIVHLLLVSLRENSPVIRAKALRAVSIIVEADPEVLGDKLVQTAVEGRFCDSAISVREAALELVGRYIASHPDVALKYFEKVSERIMDTGVSVRKRAIKIIKDMCTSIASFSEFNSACIKIISRVNDEESSIQDLVCKTFYEFWFEEPLGSERHIIADGSSVTLEIAKKTEQIVEMLRKMPNQQSLVIIIKRNLALDFLSSSVKAAGINPVSLASVRKRCELMCKCLLEKILQVEEMNTDRVEFHSLPYVLLLHAFCLVDPALCAPASDPSQFVITLQPYLKTQVNDRVVAKLLESIVFVIDSVLPFVQKLPPDVVEELEQDLKQTIVRHHFLTVVHACIKCLCSVGKVSGKGASVIENLIQVFFRRLDALGFDNEQQIGRSIFCLGLLIRYGNSLLSTSWSSKQKLDILRSLNLFKKYLQAEDFALKARSLQALGHVLIARPEFMLEKDVGRILEGTLSSTTDDRLKMQSLQNMYEYLLDAESQMETEKTDHNGESYSIGGGQSVPVAAGAGDTNICGGIIQLYWNSILERCLDVNEQVRQSALKIVEVVLRQGLVHPITCVPYLIALETDPQDVNSKLSHHLLMNMNEKYPAFFESRLGDGLQMSFMFIQSMSRTSPEISNPKNQPKGSGNTKGKTDSSSVAYARLGVCRIYKLIRGNRVSRNKFMSSIVRKFDIPSRDASVIPFLIYCTEILALLPFTLPEEPLYLIYAINRVIQVRSGSLEANMKALLHMLQGSSQKILPGNGIIHQDPSAQPAYNDTTPVDLNGSVVELGGYVDSTDTASMNVNTKAVNLANPCVISEDDLPKIQVDCLSATALQLLLKLKRHLKIVYSLDDARCQAFSPSEPPKPGEFLSRQNIPFNISDMSFNLPNSYEDFLQKYQEFKNALREDTVDYSTYTANIKRKRPPARRSAKSGHMNGAVDGDDDYDDDEWGSGVRRPSSGRKPVNTRSRNRS